MEHHKDDRELQAASAESGRLMAQLLRNTQELARLRRTTELLRGLPGNIRERIDEPLLQSMLDAEANRAAEQAIDEFPALLADIDSRVQNDLSR